MYNRLLELLLLFSITLTTCTLEDIEAFIPYTVTFNANNGSGAVPAAQTGKSGTKIILPDGSGFTRNNYAFDGWSTNKNGSGINYKSGSSYTITENITLYAKWVSGYTVTFNSNDGSGIIPPLTVKSDTVITLPGGDGLSRSGYLFDGWSTNADGMGTNFSAGSSYTVTGNIILYARWIVSSYTVIFSANGGNGTAPPLQVVNTGDSILLPRGDGLVKGIYIFSGWNTRADGTGINYEVGSSYTVSGNVTLYARWKNPALSLELGDIGPGGGRIFYRNDEGFSMTDNGQICHYLETVLLPNNYTWTNSSGYSIPDIADTSKDIGTGRKNTALILAKEANAPAARTCKNYSGGNKTDWFLPSLDELNLIYINRAYLGSIGTASYWSSSQADGWFFWDSAFHQDFNNGEKYSSIKTNSYSVRTVRAF